MAATDTIFAIATPPGAGGVGVVRLSGPDALGIGRKVTGKTLAPRRAVFCAFNDDDGQAIDSGIALYFQGPASFTGEDVVELQGHGSPVAQQMLSRRLASLGARAARPGEFSERAFLNDKLDLAQAEAIADLVSSGTESAARAAQRSLEGVFSDEVEALVARLTELRVFIEAALDFPDEEIDFIAESDVLQRLDAVIEELAGLQRRAQRGQVLRDGVTVAIVGQPNAGKSSLLNALAGRDAAIVTDIPGTTRDVLRETLSLDGLPVHIADTAGIRDSDDQVEVEGVRRARAALRVADIALLVLDGSLELEPQRALLADFPESVVTIEVINKIDLAGQAPAVDGPKRRVSLCARTGEGLDGLVGEIRVAAGLGGQVDGTFSARGRHLDALSRAAEHLVTGRQQLQAFAMAETLAEELRLAQDALGEITGKVLADDLLGAIFSSFCIGK
ncbi:tRNA uridine-5-carboxymethylaminomethyl(34) synthesis GTPase MnmE [Marinihelvus fidelis]|uniref:tRNA modification GTPase MnmE n=1 Tax=Marinihelvus fidelis TaxID=2613842 RepID=A0A5N0TBN1_9GAMM|nr:tRNA uridine-5-carboxymethylaminomethyl(34) synthesis GTPase MnmE [Marinihelvus fidelis]KAA9131487.1 tRNA uridine-5-carboxymethylaminomethyl(34) synthesis GTPase MnmE [Marinihelvus fidelis]